MAGHFHTLESTLREYAQQYGLSTFVETGTFKGTTTEMASKIFSKVYTIELSESLHQAAQERFKDSGIVTCLQGDSATVLARLVPQLDEDSFFFLDAHWAGDLSARGSSDSPLLEELALIAGRNPAYQDLVIIDDVSFFAQKGERLFTDPKSAYFPDGGLFKWDWRHVDKDKVLSLFPGKAIMEKDDRLFIGIREE